MRRALCQVSLTGMIVLLLAGCPNLPVDPVRPVPTPVPIPQPSTTATTFSSKVDTMCGNVITQWKAQASVEGVTINGARGELAAGNVKGPNLAPYFTLELGKISATDSERRIILAFSQAFSAGFTKWQSSYTATLTYSGFDAVQAPMAPSTANQPLLVSAGVGDEAALDATALADTVKASLVSLTDAEAQAVDSTATKLAARFHAFTSGTRIKNVYGSGPVPDYKPPFAPSGAVVNGTGKGAVGTVFQ